MTALIVIVSIIIYIAIGCMANIIAARLNLVDCDDDDEYLELICVLILAWPIIILLALIAYLVCKFKDYLESIANQGK